MELLELIHELQSTESEAERDKLLEQSGISSDDICEACKNAYKYPTLNMCILVEWCKWDSNFTYFKSERQTPNSRDCGNFLSDDCKSYHSDDPHDRCKDCPHFISKE